MIKEIRTNPLEEIKKWKSVAIVSLFLLILVVGYFLCLAVYKSGYNKAINETKNYFNEGFSTGQMVLMNDICSDGLITITQNNISKQYTIKDMCGWGS